MVSVLSELIKRAFTNGNGGLVRLRNEDGEWDWQAFWGLVVRVVLILLTGLAAYYSGLI